MVQLTPHSFPPRLDPLISPAAVQGALNTLLYTARARRSSPLESLWVIDQRLRDPDHPPAQDGRGVILASLLVELITAELAHHRRVNGLAVPDHTETRDEALAQIGRDGGAENVELLSWSWLYYRYVRVELSLTAGEFARAAHIDSRTRVRVRAHALRRLSERLIEREHEARRTLRKQRLIARLPPAPRVRLIGREVELTALTHTLTDSAVRLVQVSGEIGVGKTALAREALRQLIDSERIAHVVWIDHPVSCERIRAAVRQWIPGALAEDSAVAHDLPSGVVVLDDLSAFTDTLTGLEALIRSLMPLHVCVIHPDDVPFAGLSARLTVPPLTFPDMQSLMRGWAFLDSQYARTESEIAALWDQARGVPGVLLQLLDKENE